MPADQLPEQPARDAVVEAVDDWLTALTGTDGTGINEAMRAVLQRGRELRALRLANRLDREPKVEVPRG